MRIKLIASDFDGTLRRSIKLGGEVSLRTLAAIEKYQSLGGHFVLCTGRMSKSLFLLKQQYNLKGYGVAFSGSAVYNLETQKLLFDEVLTCEQTISVLKKAEKDGLQSQLYSGEDFYTEIRNDNTIQYEEACQVAGIETKEKLSDFAQKNNICAQKVLCWVSPELVMPKLKEYEAIFPGVYFCSSNEFFLEAGSKKANKGTAVEHIAKILGIKREEIAAIGDNHNDLPMIKYAGCSCTVSNAIEELKHAAKYIMPSCDEDGVAVLIEKIINEEI